MEVLKYIIKRLLLAVLILFGVSIIIYTLVRCMPNDFVDKQYSSQLTQGTIKQEDVDRIKEIYGLSMPEAFLTVFCRRHDHRERVLRGHVRQRQPAP